MEIQTSCKTKLKTHTTRYIIGLKDYDTRSVIHDIILLVLTVFAL